MSTASERVAEHKAVVASLAKFYQQPGLATIRCRLGSHDFDGSGFAEIGKAIGGGLSSLFIGRITVIRHYFTRQPGVIKLARYLPSRNTLNIGPETYSRLSAASTLTPQDEWTLVHEGVHMCNDYRKRTLTDLDDEVDAFVVAGMYAYAKFGDGVATGKIGKACAALLDGKPGVRELSDRALEPLRAAIRTEYGDHVAHAAPRTLDGL